MINAAFLIALHTSPVLQVWPEPVINVRGIYHRLTVMGQWASGLEAPDVSEPLVWYRGHPCRFVSAEDGAAIRITPISGRAPESWDPPRRVPGGFENLADAWWSGRELVVIQSLDEGFALHWFRGQEATPYRSITLPGELTTKFSLLFGPTFLNTSTESVLQINFYTEGKEFHKALVSFGSDKAVRYEIRPFAWEGKFAGKDLISRDEGLWWDGELLVKIPDSLTVQPYGVDAITDGQLVRVWLRDGRSRTTRIPLPKGHGHVTFLE